MIRRKNFRRIAPSLMLLSIILGITLTYATTENNYKNDNNFLTNISESTHTENGYKTNIVINPHTTGIYAQENGYKLDLTINTQGIGGSLKENNYKLDLTPEKTFPDTPDIAVTNIMLSKTVVGQGYTTRIKVTISNQALTYETFHLIIKANTTNIKTQTITLTSREHTTITFTWNTTGFAKGKYIISAYAWPVQGETHTQDNTLTGGIITVTIPGDVDGDFEVTILDVVKITSIYAIRLGDPRFRPNSDIDNDGKITILDVVICTSHYAQKDP